MQTPFYSDVKVNAIFGSVQNLKDDIEPSEITIKLRRMIRQSNLKLPLELTQTLSLSSTWCRSPPKIVLWNRHAINSGNLETRKNFSTKLAKICKECSIQYRDLASININILDLHISCIYWTRKRVDFMSVSRTSYGRMCQLFWRRESM